MTDWAIPGMGASKGYCGDYRHYEVRCPSGLEGHDRYGVRFGCRKFSCIECWPSAVKREANKAKERLESIQELWRDHGYNLQHPVHMIVSPPVEDYFLTEPDLRKVARSIARDAGIVGGCMVFHPYRFKGSAKREHQDFRNPLNEQQERFRDGNTRAPKYSPHYHIIGFMPSYFEGQPFKGLKSKFLQARTGWIYKNNGRVNKNGNLINLYAKLEYELTHVGMDYSKSNIHTLTWFGVCSNNSVKVSIEKHVEECLCRACKQQNHLYHDDIDQGEKFNVTVIRTYSLKPERYEKMIKNYSFWLGQSQPIKVISIDISYA